MILVLNLGLKSVRAIVFDEAGQKQRAASKTVRTHLKGSWVEQDPEEWWSFAVEVMQEVLADGSVREALEGITVTSSSCCLVSLGEHDRVLRPAMMVSDHRAVEEARELEAMDGFAEARGINGNVVSEPSVMIPKIMWLRQHEPEVFERAESFLSSNDFLIARLVGEVVTDPLNAEKFGYLPSENAYPAAMLREAAVPVEKLPRVVPQGSIAGELLSSVKTRLGLDTKRRVSVVVTTYDAICAFFGSGASEEGHACDVSGTVTSLRVFSGKARERESPSQARGRIYSQYEAQTGAHIVGGSNNLGGGLIEWAKQCLYVGESAPYEVMEAEAREGGLGAGGAVFLPYLMGERAPLWDRDARGVFFGLERRHQRRHLVRAVFESAAYALVYLKEAIDATGCHMKRLSVSGGLARVELIAQIKADVLETEVEIVDEFETTSLGAFLLTSLALNRVASLAEAVGWVRVRHRLQPDQIRSDRYRKLVAFYKDLYATSQPLFAKRKAMMEAIHEEPSCSIENL